jgi:hypothetical protein
VPWPRSAEFARASPRTVGQLPPARGRCSHNWDFLRIAILCITRGTRPTAHNRELSHVRRPVRTRNHVRFWGQSGHRAKARECQLMTQSDRLPPSIPALRKVFGTPSQLRSLARQEHGWTIPLADTVAEFYAARVVGKIHRWQVMRFEKFAGLSLPNSARLPWSVPAAAPRELA